MENKENTRPYIIREDSDTDSNDGQVLYREDYDDEKSKHLLISYCLIYRLVADRDLRDPEDKICI